MNKFAPLMFAAVAMTSVAGCATDTDMASEMTAEDQAAVCSNPEGTNAAIAALATNITQELHRWEITTDFYVKVGYNNQQMLALTSAGLAACGGTGCPGTQNMLALQDSRMDQKVIIGGQRLSSWSFASRVVSGFGNQKTCKAGGWCPYVPHVFGWKPDGTYNGYTTAAGACDTLFTFNANKPASQNHAALSASELTGLGNALIWTKANGPNPYIAFQTGASTVSIDPTGQMTQPGQTTGSEICQKFSTTDINGTDCTCAEKNIYSNGKLKNSETLTPKQYYCTQM